MADFDETQRTIATLLPVVGGIEAEKFLTDLEWALGEIDGGAKVVKTGDPGRRFEGTLRFDGEADDVAQRLVDLWVGRVAWGDRQAHRLRVEEDEICLDLLTWQHGLGMVTGRVIARRRGGRAVALRIRDDDGGIGA